MNERSEPQLQATESARGGALIECLTGLPGSGKSTYLIERVNEARATGRTVATFESSESARLMADPYVSVQRLIGCRQPGLTCHLDHLVPTDEAVTLLSQLPSGSLAAFEEAHLFADEIVPAWRAAVDREVEVIVSMPSAAHLEALDGARVEVRRFAATCDRCGQREATGFVLTVDGASTRLLCAACDAEETRATRADLVVRLEAQGPYPGERVLYQPVEIDECADWNTLRTDSEARANLMAGALRAARVVPSSHAQASYLDIGCNTGFFCNRMRRLGLYAEGVDVTGVDIDVARLLTAYIRRDDVRYTVADCYEYLRDTQDRRFAVTSAFSVFQWLMIQRTVEHGLDCLRWLFAKTDRVCFLEMGYSAEDHYKNQIGAEIDRQWTTERIDELGDFEQVLLFAAEDMGLWRDVFVGLKDGSTISEEAAATLGAAVLPR